VVERAGSPAGNSRSSSSSQSESYIVFWNQKVKKHGLILLSLSARCKKMHQFIANGRDLGGTFNAAAFLVLCRSFVLGRDALVAVCIDVAAQTALSESTSCNRNFHQDRFSISVHFNNQLIILITNIIFILMCDLELIVCVQRWGDNVFSKLGA
jgi:hypothetical protein